MAVSVGTTPERWLQGLDRLVATMAEMLPNVSILRPRRSIVPTHWVLERGPARATAPVDVLGGFPGSLRSTNRLVRTTMIATERYLVFGEGTSEGFALPMIDIRAAGLVRPSPQANPGLVIHYQDGPGVGTFALNFRGLARGLSGNLRAAEVLRMLEAQDVQRLTSDRISRSPQLALRWDDARQYANEPLAWAGVAFAAVGGWYGAIQRNCRVWLTGDSLFWCCAEGDSVNRLALSDIIEARDGVADRVKVSFRDAAGDRYDLPFDFDADAPGSAAMQQRMRFLNVLASSGVAVSTAPASLAPWRRGGTVRPPARGR